MDSFSLSSPKSANRTAWVLALLLLALGLALRLYDLTDQPIDFHATRQLRGAIIARGMYFQMLPNADPKTRELAIGFANTVGQYEPSIVEKLVAYAYLLAGEEKLWLSRIFTSLFWILGGGFLFALALRMSSAWPALAVLAYYLILPFGVQASRSFQPDPGMVMWMVLTIYALYRWSEKHSWKWALLAGLLGGVGILTKVVAAYFIGGAAAALALHTLGVRRFWRRPQVWAIATLMLLPTFLYYMGRGGRASEYFSSWTLSLSHLLLDPSWYVRWLNLVQNLMGLTPLLLALVGVLLARQKERLLLVGLGGAYLVYALFLPYQMYTHNYYHLQLIPIISLSLIPVAEAILERLGRQTRFWQALVIGATLVGIAFPAWLSIAEQNRANFRGEPAYWQEIASHLPTDGKILALTHDYCYHLIYYGWGKGILWPNPGELKLSELRGISRGFEDFFARRIEGKRYFLVTAFGQFNDQPDLKQILADRYPLIAQGDGYLIYDLENPLSGR